MVTPIAVSSVAPSIAGTRASTAASHSARPASTNESAVSFTMFGQEGTILVSCTMSKAQPASTNRPTNSATKAANCAKYRLGSALSGLPMMNQTTPMPGVPQLGCGEGQADALHQRWKPRIVAQDIPVAVEQGPDRK